MGTILFLVGLIALVLYVFAKAGESTDLGETTGPVEFEYPSIATEPEVTHQCIHCSQFFDLNKSDGYRISQEQFTCNWCYNMDGKRDSVNYDNFNDNDVY